VRVVADPLRVAQILENLLNNACKYTPDGGRIEVVAREADALVEIRIADNGIGIEPSKQPAVFELFNQVDVSIDRSKGGLGIGLAMVKKLTDLHGGTVGVDSAGLGQGSTFVVRLPRSGPGPAR
jgi:signal transduction histidine kinase